MRSIRFGSSISLMAVVAATMTVGMDLPEHQPRQIPRKMPRGYANELNRKQSRAADRGKKQHLIKGVRP